MLLIRGIAHRAKELAHRGALVGLILLVPLIGIVAGFGLEARLQSEHRTRTQTPDRLEQLCDAPGPELNDVCEIRSHVKRLEAASFLTGVFGVVLLLVIRVTGWAALKRRFIYLRAFQPGLRVVAASTVTLIALQGAVAVGVVWSVAMMLGLSIPGSILLATGVGGAIGVALFARVVFRMIGAVNPVVIGLSLDRQRAARLYDRVEDVARRLGAPLPRQVVVGLEPECFTTDASLDCLDGTHSGRTLYCSLPLIRLITVPEFDALIGHELRHPRIERRRPHEASGSYLQFPAVAILGRFHDAFAEAGSKQARDREWGADRDAARVAGPIEVASAFAKLHALGELWARIQDAASGRGLAAVEAAPSAVSLIEGVDELEERLSARYSVRVERPDRSRPDRAIERSSNRRTALLLGIALGSLAAHAREPYRVEPTTTSILGISVATLDDRWERASLIDEGNLPAYSRKDLAGTDTPYRFSADGDFNGDGLRDRAVVGVYRARDHEEGQFLLIVTERRPGSWTVAYLSKNPGFPGPSLLYSDAKSLGWVPCTACDVWATVSWKRGRYLTTWESNDE